MNEISIIGGGIGGLTLGNILKQQNIDFTLYESAAEIKPVGSGIMMAINAMQIFDKLGLKEKLNRQETKFTAFRLRMKS
jgi:2-polyprenyl-6-methoxyphenol hydroxylase-like FAD-dependent oxidoreductase